MTNLPQCTKKRSDHFYHFHFPASSPPSPLLFTHHHNNRQQLRSHKCSLWGRYFTATARLVAYIYSAVLVANHATHGQVAKFGTDLLSSTYSLLNGYAHAPATVQVAELHVVVF